MEDMNVLNLLGMGEESGIPVYFINLILSKYGMKLRGWENDIPSVDDKNKQ